MKKNWRTTAVLAAVLVSCMAGAICALEPLDRLRANAPMEEALYIPSPAVLKGLSLGYSGLMADIYWTRAVQYFGVHHYNNALRYDLLYPLLDITTRLDPHLLVAYQFGGIFLSQKPPEGAGQPDKAIELVEHGIRENPDNWKLYYSLGFIYYDMEAYQDASKVFARGSAVPGANPALAVLAASTAEKGGSPETARLLWSKLYESSVNEQIRNNARQHLVALEIDEEVPKLQQLVHTYTERTGRVPSNFDEMVAAGWLRSLPVDPMGQPYRLMPDGRVEVQSPERNRYIHHGLPGEPAASNSVQDGLNPQVSAP